MRRAHRSLSSLALASSVGVAMLVAQACSTGQVASPSLGAALALDAGGPSFAADPPSVYVAKVKNVLTGLPATADEIAAVTANPAHLTTLVGQWMQTPEYTAKMMVFFQLAFQQTQISTADFAEMIPNAGGIGVGPYMNPLVQNVSESFARTVLALVGEGKPLTSAFTATSFMMTPPLMELYAFMDQNQVDDNEKLYDAMKLANPTGTITVTASAGPIAFSDSVNPASPDYLHFYFPDLAKAPQNVTGCDVDPRVYPMNSHVIHELLYGGLDLFKNTAPTVCGSYANANDSVFTTADFADWKMVTVRAPNAGEATTSFFDVASLRSATELVLNTPRIGFFSTPAFSANWQTNTSNEMRVTTNQSLIVATGMDVDGTDTTTPKTTPGLDAVHAAPGTACFGCHQTLDPTRSILQATYSYGYGSQIDPTLTSQKGLFAFQGVVTNVSSVSDFANVLATHPAFGTAWAEKLCYYVNSQACDTSDPEFTRIVGDFSRAGFSWNTLVSDIATSPLTTNAAPTTTTLTEGVTVAVARRDHLCALLNARLGLTDVCGLHSLTPTSGVIPTIAAGLPSDGYGRGAPIPVLPNQPTLFSRAATENICEAIANEIVDAPSPPPGAVIYSSSEANGAIADFVSTLMGLESGDPRATQAQSILQQHFASAQQSGASPTYALRSTFIVACLAPTVVGMGM